MNRKGKGKPKRITQPQITGQQGVNFVEQIVLKMGNIWHPTNANLEAGIDGIIEIRDPVTGIVTNNIIQVQVKVTKRAEVRADTSTEFTYLCKERDIDYWMQGNTPVVLIAVRPQGDEAYWVNVKEVFADPERRRDRHLRFDKKAQRFDASVASAFMKLAVPKERGPYMPATPRGETLSSNLLKVEAFPPTIYSAITDYREPQDVFDWATEEEVRLPAGWLLTERAIRSVHDLRKQPWVNLVDRGTVECFDTTEWAESDDPDRQREFVRLMNQALREDMRLRGLWRSSTDNCFYFPARRDNDGNLHPKRYRYTSLRKHTSRQVVMVRRHPETKDIVYYRHNALRCTFLKMEAQWFLAMTPHYVYTIDGTTPYPYAADLLSGMKRREHQDAVFHQTVMWRYRLTHLCPRGLFDHDERPKPFIMFGDLLQVGCDRGVDDKNWLPSDALLTSGTDEDDDSDDWELF